VVEDRSRTRTHEWSEPLGLAESMRPLSGQEFFQAWSRGEVTPPIAATLGFTLEDFGDGHVVISCVPDEFHYNPYGSVHGGLAATLLDTATACAVQTRLPSGSLPATLNLSVSYLRPLTSETGLVRSVGKVVSMGRTVAVSEADVVDESGRVLARATATCLLLNS
jgi:uncharacterized protein (TIGR00369 family)